MIKRTTLFLVCCLMGIMSTWAQGRILANAGQEGDDYVNVHSGQSAQSSVVRRINAGTSVYVTPTGGNWYRVSLTASGAFIGYVHPNHVDFWYTCIGERYDATYDYVVTDPDGWTNVRLQATTKSNIVKRLNRGVHFLGKQAIDAPNWIGVFSEDHRLVGFVYTTKVRRMQRMDP